MMDGEVSARIEELFREWGVDLKFGCTVDDVAPSGDALDVTLSTQEHVGADTVLIAAGRVANTEHLGLESAGVRVDARGRIEVDGNFRTSADGIYAAGDVLEPTLASIAMEQGRAAVCSAFGIPFEGNVDPTPVSAIYGMPELSGAGLTEEACRERGLSYEVGRADLALTPRGAIAGRGGHAQADLSKGRPKAARRSLHRRHRIGNRRNRSDGDSLRRHAEYLSDDVVQYADVQLRVQIRGTRRTAAARRTGR